MADIDEVIEIENECFPCPWARDDFVQVLNLDPAYAIVYTITTRHSPFNQIIGYGIAFIEESSLHIANLAVKMGYRKRGIGSAILKNLLDYGKLNGSPRPSPRSGKRETTLEVRVSNLPTINLYQKFGFNKLRIKKEYYSDGENALVMKK
ncbi:ribosomal protein S18-alanine N-acetyltransferase [candidate division WOR-3 bacterium]|nr:ribosomal protein S18-alanine N-acetyltransferase [candidate division WOR-3 bacterium]